MPAALRILGAACAALTVLALAPTAVASADEEICLFCHEDLENEEGQRVAAELDLFPESVHGELGLACGDCHTDVAGLDGDHPEELEPAACGDCHEAAEEIAASSHAGALLRGLPRQWAHDRADGSGHLGDQPLPRLASFALPVTKRSASRRASTKTAFTAGR